MRSPWRGGGEDRREIVTEGEGHRIKTHHLTTPVSLAEK